MPAHVFEMGNELVSARVETKNKGKQCGTTKNYIISCVNKTHESQKAWLLYEDLGFFFETTHQSSLNSWKSALGLSS